MDPALAPLRRSVLVSLGAVGALALALGPAFRLLVPVPSEEGCTSSLPAGVYGDVLVPVHVAAGAVLGGCVLWLATRRAGATPVHRPTAIALGVLALYGLASMAAPSLFELPAFVLAILFFYAGPALAVVLLVRLWQARNRALAGVSVWRHHALSTLLLCWDALVLGVAREPGARRLRRRRALLLLSSQRSAPRRRPPCAATRRGPYEATPAS